LLFKREREKKMAGREIKLGRQLEEQLARELRAACPGALIILSEEDEVLNFNDDNLVNYLGLLHEPNVEENNG